ncbi:hypothetical protein [Jeotgalibacillus soli]|uniref:Uncharacterized protein n=1 Tax=Jeotgalibacillus soli TaxID=889306 RepID=A0A0C2S7Q2_9BACL|nr:hypothetical protein [Jeotgalibacillus soli]KIL50014.1 hypothetical protein KP78_14820 [Jeotgalibacillus soli]
MEQENFKEMHIESEEHSAEILNQVESSTFENRSNQFNNWFFGNRRQERDEKAHNENHVQKRVEQNESSSMERRSHPFDDWIFGSRRKESVANKEKVSISPNQQENFLNNVNVEDLFVTMDTLVKSFNKIKPLIKEAKPYFLPLLKKLKSNEKTD